MRTLLMATVAIIGSAVSAEASVSVFTSATSFNAAVGSKTSYSFPSNSPSTTSETSPFTFGPLTFADATIDLNNDGFYGNGVVYLSGYNSPSTGVSYTVTTSGAPGAISFNLGTYNPVEMLSVAVNGATVATIPGTTGAPSTTFIGFTDTSPITSVVFTNLTTPGDEIDITSFAVGTFVTEPASIALLSVGVLGLAVSRRRTRPAYIRSR